MRRIGFLLVAAIALTGGAAYMSRAPAQADGSRLWPGMLRTFN